MLTTTINTDFVTAYKAGDIVKKNCLGSIKTRITEWGTSKQNAGKTITDGDVIGILTSEAKKRKDAIALYEQDGSVKGLTKANHESQELAIIQSYLPKQLTEEELKAKVTTFISRGPAIAPGDKKEARAAFGAVMMTFATLYRGQYDPQLLKKIAEQVLEL